MKHYLAAALAAVLTCLTGCSTEDAFQILGMEDLITVRGNTFVNDANTVFTIQEDKTDGNWEDGARYLVLLDVLDKDLHVRVLARAKCNILAAAPDQAQYSFTDPVVIPNQSVSGGYLNLQLNWYYTQANKDAHKFYAVWKTLETKEIVITLYHEGLGENPVEMDQENLKKASAIYCIPLEGIVSPDGPRQKLSLVYHALAQDKETGELKIQERTYMIYDGTIVL
ncbi:MAG: hypothetical protein J6Y31_03140 [Bacteroidales bacterium]|nr:hypothetical protein [Bacteroidales bacterium]MBP5373895.1 hypothetical protein [Bacteroidales bacterium]